MTISRECSDLACRTCVNPHCDHSCHLRMATPVLAPARSTVPGIPTPSPTRVRLSEEVPGQPAERSGHGRPAPHGVNGAPGVRPEGNPPAHLQPRQKRNVPGGNRGRSSTERTADMHSAATPIVQRRGVA